LDCKFPFFDGFAHARAPVRITRIVQRSLAAFAAANGISAAGQVHASPSVAGLLSLDYCWCEPGAASVIPILHWYSLGRLAN